jgi:hypothetical protein
MRFTFRFIWLMACIAIAMPLLAQYGHPLKGTWSGSWGPSADHRNHVLLEFNWDGKAITGTVNPGPDAIAFKSVELDPKTWMVKATAEAKDRRGQTVSYVVEGKLENLGAYRRVFKGTWSHDGRKGDFEVTRN